jgi:hypothetical protein
MKAFTDSRRIFWLAGVGVVVFGLLAAFVILPATSSIGRDQGPKIDVPGMQNVPPPEAPNLKLDLNKQE